MLKVFISYVREDGAFAMALASRLKADGFAVLIDREVLVAGERWEDQIGRAIHDADFVVLLLSRHTQRSRWVQRELTTALESSNRNRIITVLRDEKATENLVWPLVADRVAIRETSLAATIEAVVQAVRSAGGPGEAHPWVPLWRVSGVSGARWLGAGALTLLAVALLFIDRLWSVPVPSWLVNVGLLGLGVLVGVLFRSRP